MLHGIEKIDENEGATIKTKTYLHNNNNNSSTSNEQKLKSVHKLFHRFNSFIHFYFLNNKRLFIFSILNYVCDLFLFISLNIYLLTNKTILSPIDLQVQQQYEKILITTLVTTTQSTTSNSLLNTTQFILNTTNSNNITLSTNNVGITLQKRAINYNTNQVKYELKQSYLTLEIVALLIFFIYFILNNLIKIQFKYHRLAINKNKYGYSYNSDNKNNKLNDEDDEYENSDDNDKVRGQFNNYSFTTSFSSHYSSSTKSGRTNKVKKIVKIILSKFSSYLLYFFYGYQYCQNTFLTDISFQKSMNLTDAKKDDSDVNNDGSSAFKINILLTVIIISATLLRVVIYYLKCYLVTETQQQRKSIKDYNYIFLFFGYNLSFYHVFSFPIAFKLSLTLFIVIIVKHLLVYKQLKSVLFQMCIFVICLNSYFRAYLKTSFNVTLFLCFLITFFYKKISFNCCAKWSSSLKSKAFITSFDVLNKRFLCKNLKFHKFCILATFIFKLVFLAIIILVFIAKYRSYYFSLVIALPILGLLSVIWLLFNLLNIINLWFVMNKISECYKIGIESSESSSHFVSNKLDNDDNTLEQLSTNRAASSIGTSYSLKNFFIKLFKSKQPVELKVLNRIMAYNGIRYLATISYYIGVICFIQTLLLILFVININSILILNLFIIVICINLFWLNLIYELSSIISGTSIIYALVAPIDDSSTNRIKFLKGSINSETNGLINGNASVPTYQNTYYQKITIINVLVKLHTISHRITNKIL